jgi:ABC-2 type transport system permease protein
MDKVLLKFVLFISKFFLSQDIDFEKLKIITETKLLMDTRRIRVGLKNNNYIEESSDQNYTAYIFYSIIGLLLSGTILFLNDIVMSMAFLHSYVLFMMSMTLITDFSAVMLDTTDSQIILPRPVSSKTLFVSRLVHILVYLLQFTIAISFFPVVTTFISFGPLVGFTSIFTVLLTVLFSVFLTYLLYGLILKFSSEHKLKEIINGFQIALTVLMVTGFQIIPRLINIDILENVKMSIHWYTYLLPPLWMSHLLESVYIFTLDRPHLILIALALIVPPFTFWVLIKYLAPSFSRKIALLGTASAAIGNNNIQSKKSFSEKISRLVCYDKIEEAGFQLVWTITNRDKNFKLQFYPSLAYIIIFIFLFVFKSRDGFAKTFQDLPNTNNFLWFIYVPIMGISTAATLISFNENFAASWIYYSRPLNKPGLLISGSIKSLILKYLIPITCVLFSFSFFVWGIKIVDDFILGFVNSIFFIFILTQLSNKYLPFSMQPNINQQSGKFVQTMLQFILVGFLVGLHYFILKIGWLTFVLIPVFIIIDYYLLKMIQNYSWNKIPN